MLGIPRTTFYRWYDRYQTEGPEALADRPPNKPTRVWNRIPAEIRQRVVQLGGLACPPALPPLPSAPRRAVYWPRTADSELPGGELPAGPDAALRQRSLIHGGGRLVGKVFTFRKMYS